MLAGAGARLTSIDLTERAVSLARTRLHLKGLEAEVRIADAEDLPFSDDEFDFVWSWGVIHHSADMHRAMREISRVLRPGGETRLMIYNRRSLAVAQQLLRAAVTGKLLKGWSIEQVLSFYSDGHFARFLTREQLGRELETSGLSASEISVMGQTSELIWLPGRGRLGAVKSKLVRRFPQRLAGLILARLGSFLFAVASPSGLPRTTVKHHD